MAAKPTGIDFIRQIIRNDVDTGKNDARVASFMTQRLSSYWSRSLHLFELWGGKRF